MQPIKFPECNVTFAADQPEYIPLMAFMNDSPEAEVITCWKATWWERLKFLVTGKMWICNSTFGKSLQPIIITVNKSDVLITNPDATTVD